MGNILFLQKQSTPNINNASNNSSDSEISEYSTTSSSNSSPISFKNQVINS